MLDLVNSKFAGASGSEGYRTPEVTLGGIDTNEISSKTMMSLKNPGLFFNGHGHQVLLLVNIPSHIAFFT